MVGSAESPIPRNRRKEPPILPPVRLRDAFSGFLRSIAEVRWSRALAIQLQEECEAKEAEEPHPSVIRREARQDFLTRASRLMKRVKPEQEAQSRRRTGASFRRFLGTANSAEPAAPLDS